MYCSVLYAEDDAIVRRTTTSALEQYGHRVLAASDGNEAVQLFTEHMSDIDLAVLDVVMPGLRGNEVLQQLRVRCSELPVVFCSGYVSKPVNQDILNHPYTWLIDKPFTTDALLEKLDHALATKSNYELTTA